MIKNLKELRRKKNISQQHLAGILGVSQQSINKYENHNVEPDISTLIAMAEYFDTTIDFLVGRCNNPDLSDNAFSPKEQTLVQNYRRLNDTERVCIDTLVNTYLDKK